MIYALSCCPMTLFQHSCKRENIFLFLKLKHVPSAYRYVLSKRNTDLRKSRFRPGHAASDVVCVEWYMAFRGTWLCFMLAFIQRTPAEIRRVEGITSLVFCKATYTHVKFSVLLFVQKSLKTLFAFWSKSLTTQTPNRPIHPLTRHHLWPFHKSNSDRME